MKFILGIHLFGILIAQQIPFGKPFYSDLKVEKKINQVELIIPYVFSESIFNNIKPVSYDDKNIYYLEISLKKNEPFQFTMSSFEFRKGMTIFFIDKNSKGWIGPYTKESFNNSDSIITGRLKTDRVLIELSINQNESFQNPIKLIEHPKEKLKRKENRNLNIDNRQGNNRILLGGYWPPSNEGIRPFSRNLMLNPNGWIGENWEQRGFDIISYFPSFSDPDCESCGQGYGDLEVDYQDTSEDWWNIIDSINPIAIITFSRGYIDFSWELEWQYFNHYNWVADFTEPFIPTPCPPDSSFPPNSPRYSSLPMDQIINEIEIANIGLYPYIDYTNGAGAYLSEFMGYHGVWNKAKMDSMHVPCIVAGHVHVGGLIDWDTARQAVEITLREVIEVVNEYQNTPGDINQDGVISVLDILKIIDYVVWSSNLSEREFEKADINFDEVIDIFDLMLLVNIILDL
jgi:hypothetical protein